MILTESHEIRALIGRLIKERVAITVLLPGRGGYFSSLLLEMDRESSALLADELVPVQGHAAMRAGMEVRVIARLDGTDMRFRCQVVEVAHHSPASAYTLALPAAVEHLQRRRAYRVPVPASMPIEVEVQPEDSPPMQGRLIDISQAGVRIELRAIRPPPPAVVWDCRIVLPDGEILARVETRHAIVDRRGPGVIHVGARFVDIGRGQQRLIGRFAAIIQRQRLRARLE